MYLALVRMPYLVRFSKRFSASDAAIYNHVLEGNVLKAIELTNQLAVDLLGSNPDVHFDLLTLHFVELVRAKDWYELQPYRTV